jgi:ribose 5-phosphate isomerase B
MAQQAKAVNNCNVLVFGEWLSPAKHACLMLDIWLSTEFTEGVTEDWKIFLSNCVKEIRELEEEQFK